MAPMRGERGGSPVRGGVARVAHALPLSRRLIRQIARHVASSGRELQRLEVSGRVIDNFADIGADADADDSDPDTHLPLGAAAATALGAVGALPEERGGGGGCGGEGGEDDELTSLTWLQDRNLLRGINQLAETENKLHSPKYSVIVKRERERCVTPEGRAPWALVPGPPVKAPPHEAPPPEAPLSLAKPPYSFSCLIFMAIDASPTRALPVKEIYAWIIRHFPYFKDAPQGWKNSVRHNLSLNKCFHKVAAAPGLGKGSLWTVDPQHRGTLLQAFGRVRAPGSAPGSKEGSPVRGSNSNAPDPQLFPFLSRRLGARRQLAPAPEPEPEPAPGASCPELGAGEAEYLAAATVLAIKYGRDVLDKLPPLADVERNSSGIGVRETFKRERDDNTSDSIPAPAESPYDKESGAGVSVGVGVGGRMSEVPSDHSYSACVERRTAEALLHLAGLLS